MRNLFLLILFCVSVPLFAQNNVAIVSVYGSKIGVDDPESPTKNLKQFIDMRDLHHKAVQKRLDDIIAELGKQFTLLADDFLQDPAYQSLLDGYEMAPYDVQFSLTGFNLETGQTVKQDYRLSSDHVVFYEEYLAIGTGKPFKNDKAIGELFTMLPEAKAFLFIEFAPGIDFTGNQYGVGTGFANVSLQFKLVDSNLKTLLARNLGGKAATKVNIKLRDFYEEEWSASYDEAINDLIANINSKLAKPVSKIKW